MGRRFLKQVKLAHLSAISIEMLEKVIKCGFTHKMFNNLHIPQIILNIVAVTCKSTDSLSVDPKNRYP